MPIPVAIHGAMVGAGIVSSTLISSASAPRVALPDVQNVSEHREREVIGGRDRPGHMVPIAEGDPTRGLFFTVHGINDDPDSCRPLSEAAATSGGPVYTFAYDDRYRSLEDSSFDLAGEIEAQLGQAPEMTISGHSMGARVSLGALKLLQDRGELASAGPITLNLVAPVLAGFPSANGAMWAPHFIDHLIGGVQPGRGMGTHSPFQEMVEGLRLPANVRVHIFAGSKDTMVDHLNPSFLSIAHNLEAELTVLEGADHNSSVAAAAELLIVPQTDP